MAVVCYSRNQVICLKLPLLLEIVLMLDFTVQDWTYNQDDYEGPDIIVNHSGWSRPFLADHAQLAWFRADTA
jgi:hypothetical protein